MKRVVATSLSLIAALLTPTATATGSTDLRVIHGSVQHRAGGLGGSFLVHNSGGHRSGLARARPADRTAFDALTFAGVLATNTSPVGDTGSTQQRSIAEAARRFHVLHLAHTEDAIYPLADVRRAVRPDLVISNGAVRTRHSRLQGSFVIVNGGYRIAGPSRARITVRIDGRDRLIRRYEIPGLVVAGARRLELDVARPIGRQQNRAVVTACVDVRRQVTESDEHNNCHRMGTVAVRHS